MKYDQKPRPHNSHDIAPFSASSLVHWEIIIQVKWIVGKKWELCHVIFFIFYLGICQFIVCHINLHSQTGSR
jgi:hypothetical protein